MGHPPPSPRSALLGLLLHAYRSRSVGGLVGAQHLRRLHEERHLASAARTLPKMTSISTGSHSVSGYSLIPYWARRPAFRPTIAGCGSRENPESRDCRTLEPDGLERLVRGIERNPRSRAPSRFRSALTEHTSLVRRFAHSRSLAPTHLPRISPVTRRSGASLMALALWLSATNAR